MFDSPKSESTTLFCERVVLADRVVPASIRIENGVIAEIAEGDRKGTELDDQVLIPGIVDVHTDHVETHVFPRSTVRWAFLPSLMAHDGVAVSGGTTTVFDSLCVGSSVKRPERVEILGPLIDAMEEGRARGAFRADHLLHLRCEISDTETMDLVDQNIGRDITRLVSVMDHTPGDRQSPDVDRWMRHMIKELGIGEEEGRARLEELLERSARVGADVRAHVVAAAKARGIPVMSHDDRSEAHAELAASEGGTISEFPTTTIAARKGKELGLSVVAGAPNYLRGGSQSGNIAVKDLLLDGLVDALASDYVPRSLLDAAFAIAADETLPIDLPRSVAMVTSAPAKLAGLDDRGEITVGQRADLAAVRVVGTQPHVTGVWREGRRVF